MNERGPYLLAEAKREALTREAEQARLAANGPKIPLPFRLRLLLLTIVVVGFMVLLMVVVF